LGEGPEPPALLRELVEQKRLGKKTGRGFFEYD
jgi:3-hydroxyacyl-CoA dehydrogenase